MQKPLISVIVPIYNAEKYLHRCMDSILNQTYKNLEIVLIDDGSKDSSGTICDAYAAKDSRIKVIHQENSGVSAARNAGLDAAFGDYITFVDSDDYITADMIYELYRTCEDEHCDCSIGGYYGVGIRNTVRWSVIPKGVCSWTGVDFLRNHMNDEDIPSCLVCNKLFHHQLWDSCRFPLKQLYEDSWIMPEIYSRCKKISTFPKGTYYYCEHEVSIMHSTNADVAALNRLNLFDHLFDFYREIGLHTMYLSEAAHYVSHFRRFISQGLTLPTDVSKKSQHYFRLLLTAPIKDVPLKIKVRLIWYALHQ